MIYLYFFVNFFKLYALVCACCGILKEKIFSMYVNITGSANNKDVYIYQSYRKENGKTSSRIYKKLGKYNALLEQFDNDNEKLMAWAKEEARKETEAYNNKFQNVYRSLSVMSEESFFIQEELYCNSNFVHSRKTKILYYDCSNYYFEIEEEDGNKYYGKSKENRPNPIVTMGLFMDADGIPLAFDIFPGNQNEQTTLKPLETTIIRDFNCSEFIFCSDAGLGSLNNRHFNSFGNSGYVPSYKRTELTDLLHDTFEFRTDYEFITKSSMRNIIKNTKTSTTQKK